MAKASKEIFSSRKTLSKCSTKASTNPRNRFSRQLLETNGSGDMNVSDHAAYMTILRDKPYDSRSRRISDTFVVFGGPFRVFVSR